LNAYHGTLVLDSAFGSRPVRKRAAMNFLGGSLSQLASPCGNAPGLPHLDARLSFFYGYASSAT
jgi:hypothetical protein